MTVFGTALELRCVDDDSSGWTLELEEVVDASGGDQLVHGIRLQVPSSGSIAQLVHGLKPGTTFRLRHVDEDCVKSEWVTATTKTMEPCFDKYGTDVLGTKR